MGQSGKRSCRDGHALLRCYYTARVTAGRHFDQIISYIHTLTYQCSGEDGTVTN